MNSIDVTIRETKSKGEISALRAKGIVPGIIYGGTDENQKISLSKKIIKSFIDKENFLSNILTLNINGKTQNVLPREVAYDVISDEPIHLDFLRIIKGKKIILEIPVKFINHESSPGLKRGGVLNVVRRKVELKCPTEQIPTELVVDLEGVDIGQSFKISSIKLPENVTPTIQGRDFVVATLAAPTVMKEPEKPAEAAEGSEDVEGEGVATEGTEEEIKPTAEGDKKDKDADKKETDAKKTPVEKK
tara:strand:- start:257 stop:994 length:738 start_codon:yes stop_codon:yes gene_type:complete